MTKLGLGLGTALIVLGLVAVPQLAAGQGPPARPLTERDVSKVDPDHAETATLPDKVPWCTQAWTGENWDGARLGRSLNYHSDDWKEGALRLCLHPTEHAYRLGAQYLIQGVMNDKSMTQAEAEAGIAKVLGLLLAEMNHAPAAAGDGAQFSFSQSDFSPIQPDPGVATAKVPAAPSWCQGVKVTEHWDPGRIGRTVSNKYGITGTIDGAFQICEHPTNMTWQIEAGYILQKWMNFGHFSQVDAEASLRARIQKTKFAADHDALCKSLEVSPEAGGEVKTFAEAHQRFFGCKDLPVWLDRSGMHSQVGFYLEIEPRPESEFMRMYWLVHFVSEPWRETELPSRNAHDNEPLLTYAIAARDFAELDKGALEKQLGAAPYNDYARTVAMETLAMLKAEQQAYEAAIDKMTKGDKDYQHLLREVPKQGFDQWERLVSQWRPELERSNAFEKKLSEPSHSALKGCSAQLKKDAEKLIKSYKDQTYHGLIAKLAADPIASLLLQRLSICDGADGVYGIAGALGDIVKHGRPLRGPRTSAYYAMLEALSKLKSDRPRMLFELDGFRFEGAADNSDSLDRLYDDELKIRGSAPSEPEKSYNRGIVKSVAKVPEGLLVTFKTDRISFPHYDCSDDTSHPLKINQNTGAIEYSRNCTATGKMDSQDQTAPPIVIAAGAANGVVPGATIVCETLGNTAANGTELGFVVYVKKSAKDPKLATFFGFDL